MAIFFAGERIPFEFRVRVRSFESLGNTGGRSLPYKLAADYWF